VARLNHLIVIATLALAIGCAYPIASRSRSLVAASCALGVWSIAVVVIALQFLGLLAAVSGHHCVGGSQLLVVLGSGCIVSWASAWLRKRSLVANGGAPRQRFRTALRVPRQWGLRRAVIPTVTACLVLMLLVSALASGLLAPPRGWDVMSYHLPRAVAWLQHGDLGHYGGNAAYYPGNGELVVLTALFSGSDRLVPVVQLPFALLATLAVFGIARQLGAGRRAALLSAFCFLSAPIVVFQCAIAKNDLIAAGTMCAAVYFALRASRRDAPRGERALDSLTLGLAVGLAIGTRYPALPLGLAVLALTFVPLAVRRADHRGESSLAAGFAKPAVLAVVGACLTSAYWYISNWLAAGNPFAPFGLRVAGASLWPGVDPTEVYGAQQFYYVKSIVEWWWFPLRDRALNGSYSAAAGFGAAFAALAIPASIRIVSRRSTPGVSDERLRSRRFLVALAAIAIAIWWFGGHRLPRFLLPAVALLTTSIGVLLEDCRRSASRALEIVLVIALTFSGAETLRVLHAGGDLTSSMLGRMDKEQLYRMPAWIHSLPPGTKIALTRITDHQYYSTFRYPLVGQLPGNEIVMEGDVGVSFDILRDGVRGLHDGLTRDGVDYLFVRAFGMEPCRLTHDMHPDLYEPVLDLIEPEYPWYRKGSPVLTKVYRVLPP